MGTSAPCWGRYNDRPKVLWFLGATGTEQDSVLVGLDYATAFVQVCIMDAGGTVLATGRCANHWLELARYVGRFGRRAGGVKELFPLRRAPAGRVRPLENLPGVERLGGAAGHR
jgi:hypothetical protein